MLRGIVDAILNEQQQRIDVINLHVNLYLRGIHSNPNTVNDSR
jgi:hypothetical protein